jgi:hypothetical protein
MSYTLKQAEDALDKLTSTGEALKADILKIVKQVSIETLESKANQRGQCHLVFSRVSMGITTMRKPNDTDPLF